MARRNFPTRCDRRGSTAVRPGGTRLSPSQRGGRGRRLLLAALAAAAALALGLPGRGPGPALAAGGDLDPSFGAGGKVTTDFDGSNDTAIGFAIQKDRKTVAAGGATVGGSGDFALARYDPDGSLDTTFSTDGRAITNFEGGDDFALDVAIQKDRKIAAAGAAQVGGKQEFALARYNPDGTLDTTFSSDGRVTTTFGAGNDVAFDLAIQKDGKIVAAGVAGFGLNANFALARYNADGSLDTTFSSDGKATTDLGGPNDVGWALVIQKDAKILLAGISDAGGTGDFALARYNPDGSLDITFGTAGRVSTDFAGSADQALALAIQKDRKIVAAGGAIVGGNVHFGLARYNPDGSLDGTFGAGGKVTTDFAGGNDAAFALGIQKNRKIVAAGSAVVAGNSDFAVARYNPDGSLDTTFSGGKVTTDFDGADDIAFALGIQKDQKIAVAGRAAIGAAFDFAVARYLPK